jgi:hypothetical protein
VATGIQLVGFESSIDERCRALPIYGSSLESTRAGMGLIGQQYS